MSQTISDAILDLASKTAAGEDHRAKIEELLQQALPATEQQLEAVRQHAPNNPEFSHEIAQAFEDGILRLRDLFQSIQTNLGAPAERWSSLAQELAATIGSIRKAQASHQELIEDGETSHLFLNRLLLHLKSWSQGRPPGPMTAGLIQGIPHFENDLRSFVEEFEEDVQERMNVHMDHLMDTCAAVIEAVQRGQASQDELQRWQSQIIQFSQDLDQVLAETVESHLAYGPTPFPVVNLVTAAMDRFFGNLIGVDDLTDTMDQCEDWLRTQLPADIDASLQEAAEQLFRVLQEMKVTAQRGDLDALTGLRESLLSAAENLAMFAAVLSPEDSVVNLVSTEGLGAGAGTSEQRPMPQLLAQILQQAESYLSGSSNSEALEESLASLDRLISSTEGQMARSRDSKEIRERTQQALEVLSEASQLLWDFVEQPGDEKMAQIEELLEEASDVVNSLSPRRR